MRNHRRFCVSNTTVQQCVWGSSPTSQASVSARVARYWLAFTITAPCPPVYASPLFDNSSWLYKCKFWLLITGPQYYPHLKTFTTQILHVFYIAWKILFICYYFFFDPGPNLGRTRAGLGQAPFSQMVRELWGVVRHCSCLLYTSY